MCAGCWFANKKEMQQWWPRGHGSDEVKKMGSRLVRLSEQSRMLGDERTLEFSTKARAKQMKIMS
jgi:hypothetical protein